MSERLLCERDVLVKTNWPSRSFIDRRMKSDGFPKPARRLPGIGDQWSEADVDTWITGKPKMTGNRLMERFAP